MPYARKDLGFLEKLKRHLAPLQREGLVDTLWYDREISAGAEWAKEIDEHLNTAQIILLLISPDFIASDYCYSIEMKRAIERHESKEATVIPVILRPCDWQGSPFGKLQALPPNARPVTDSRWNTQDYAYDTITKGIRKAIKEFPQQEEIAVEQRALPEDIQEPENTQPKQAEEIDLGNAPPNAPEQLPNIPDASNNTAKITEDVFSGPPYQDVLDRLKEYRNKLANMEVTLDLGGKDELDEQFVRGLDRLGVSRK